MPIPINGPEVLNREFLEIRAKLLQLAAHFDRLDRAGGLAKDDPRLGKIQQALGVLGDDKLGRAEKLQLLFSRTYSPEWRAEFGIAPADAATAAAPTKSR